MAIGNRGINEYKKTAVNSASPLQLVVMLYDAALKHCEAAKLAIKDKDLKAQNDNLLAAQRILTELVASLDMKQGAEIAQSLFGLYSYCLNELSDANIQDKIEPIERSIRVLSELREAWAHIRSNEEPQLAA